MSKYWKRESFVTIINLQVVLEVFSLKILSTVCYSESEYHLNICEKQFEADFQCSASSIFLKFSEYCCETSVIQIQQRKVKNVFSDKN